jgi:hypothetical protein
LPFGIQITYTNSQCIFSFGATNTLGVQKKLIFTLAGRTEITSGDSSQDYQAFSIFKSNDEGNYFSFGWTRAQEETKVATFTYTMPETETSVTFELRAAKTATNSYGIVWVSGTTVTSIGVRN